MLWLTISTFTHFFSHPQDLAHFYKIYLLYQTELRTHLFHAAFPEEKKYSPALIKGHSMHTCVLTFPWILLLFSVLDICSSLSRVLFKDSHIWCLLWSNLQKKAAQSDRGDHNLITSRVNLRKRQCQLRLVITNTRRGKTSQIFPYSLVKALENSYHFFEVNWKYSKCLTQKWFPILKSHRSSK